MVPSPLFPSPAPTPTTHGPPSSPSFPFPSTAAVSYVPPSLPFSLPFSSPILPHTPSSSPSSPILLRPPSSPSPIRYPFHHSPPPIPPNQRRVSSSEVPQKMQSLHAEFPSAWQALASLPQPLGQPELTTWHPLPLEELKGGKGEHGEQGELGGNGAVEQQRGEEWGEVVGGGQRGSMGQQRYCTYVDEFVKAGRGDEVGKKGSMGQQRYCTYVDEFVKAGRGDEVGAVRCYGWCCADPRWGSMTKKHRSCTAGLFPYAQPLLPPAIPQPSSSISPNPIVFPSPLSSSSPHHPLFFSCAAHSTITFPIPPRFPPLSPFSPSLSPFPPPASHHSPPCRPPPRFFESSFSVHARPSMGLASFGRVSEGSRSEQQCLAWGGAALLPYWFSVDGSLRGQLPCVGRLCLAPFFNPPSPIPPFPIPRIPPANHQVPPSFPTGSAWMVPFEVNAPVPLPPFPITPNLQVPPSFPTGSAWMAPFEVNAPVWGDWLCLPPFPIAPFPPSPLPTLPTRVPPGAALLPHGLSLDGALRGQRPCVNLIAPLLFPPISSTPPFPLILPAYHQVPPSFPTGSAWMVPFEVVSLSTPPSPNPLLLPGNSSRDESEPVFVFAFHSAFLRIGLTRITLHELDCAYGGDIQVPADFFIDVLIEMPRPRGDAPLADAHSDGTPAGTMLTWQQLLAAYRDDFMEASRKQRMAQGREETRLGRAEAERSEWTGGEGVKERGSSTFTLNQQVQERLKPEISRISLAMEAVDGRDRRDEVGDERRSLARSLVTEVQAHPLLRHTGQASHPGMLSVPPMPPGTAFMSPEVPSSQYDLPPTPTTPHMPPSPHSPLPQLPSLPEDFSPYHSPSAPHFSSTPSPATFPLPGGRPSLVNRPFESTHTTPAAEPPSQELDSLADLLIRMSLSTGSRHSMGGAALKGGERHGRGLGGSKAGERHGMEGKGVQVEGVGFEHGEERHRRRGGAVGEGSTGDAEGISGEGSVGGAVGMGEERQSMGNGRAFVSAIGGKEKSRGGGDVMGGGGEDMGDGKGMGGGDVREVMEGREAGGEWRAGAGGAKGDHLRATSGKLAAPGMGEQQGEGEGQRADGEGDLFPPARPLHWSKVTNVKGTVWEEIEREGAVKKEREETRGDGGSKGNSVLVSKVTLPDDMRRAIRVLFQVKATKPGGKSKAGGGLQGEGGGMGGRKGLGKDELQVVGLARANNVAIMLTQFRMPENQIRDLILAGDPKHVLPPDRLGLLLQVIPTEEEAARFRAVSGAASGAMCAPERFLWSISLIPRMRRKIEALMFVRHFHTIVNDARAVIKVFCSAARAIRSSKVLRAALAAALEVGNELNRGSVRGSARGFSLDSLARLSEVRVTPPSHRTKGLNTLLTAAQVPSESTQKLNPSQILPPPGSRFSRTQSFPVIRATAPSSSSSTSSSSLSSSSPSPFSSSSSSSSRPSSPFPTSSTLAATTPAASPFPSHPSQPSHPPPLIARATTLLDVVVIITRGMERRGEEEAGEVGSSLLGSSVRNKRGEGGEGRRGKLTVDLAAVGEAVRMSQADVADATSALDTGLRLVDEEVRLLQQEREAAGLKEGEGEQEEEEEEGKEREEGEGKGHDSKGEVERQWKGKGAGEGGLMTVLAEFRLNARKEREELATDAEECRCGGDGGEAAVGAFHPGLREERRGRRKTEVAVQAVQRVKREAAVWSVQSKREEEWKRELAGEGSGVLGREERTEQGVEGNDLFGRGERREQGVEGSCLLGREERRELGEEGQVGGTGGGTGEGRHDRKGEVERQRKGKAIREGGMLAVLAEFRLNARKEREELAKDAEECSPSPSLRPSPSLPPRRLHFFPVTFPPPPPPPLPPPSFPLPVAFTSSSLRLHFLLPLPSLPPPFAFTSSSLRLHFLLPSPSLPPPFAFTSSFLRPHFLLPSPSLPPPVAFISPSRRLHFPIHALFPSLPPAAPLRLVALPAARRTRSRSSPRNPRLSLPPSPSVSPSPSLPLVVALAIPPFSLPISHTCHSPFPTHTYTLPFFPVPPHLHPCSPPSPSLFPPISIPVPPHLHPCSPPSPSLFPPISIPVPPHLHPCSPPSPSLFPPISIPVPPHLHPCSPPSPSLFPPISIPVPPHLHPCSPPSPSLFPPISIPIPPHLHPCSPPSPSLFPFPAPPRPLPSFSPSPSLPPPIPFPASPLPLPCFPPSPSLLPPVPFPPSPRPLSCLPPSPSLLPLHPLPCFPHSPSLLPPVPFPPSPRPPPSIPPSPSLNPPIPFPASPHPLPCFPPSPSLLPPIPFPAHPCSLCFTLAPPVHPCSL
ncbi:unnamed protein product [Closterium sp. Naga37s-1]|nr:unnamed protein product [Closterium sp. Naga37s-1]